MLEINKKSMLDTLLRKGLAWKSVKNKKFQVKVKEYDMCIMVDGYTAFISKLPTFAIASDSVHSMFVTINNSDNRFMRYKLIVIMNNGDTKTFSGNMEIWKDGFPITVSSEDVYSDMREINSLCHNYGGDLEEL